MKITEKGMKIMKKTVAKFLLLRLCLVEWLLLTQYLQIQKL